MCEFFEMDCPKECGRKVKRKDLGKHLEEECPSRLVPCRYCQRELKWNGLEVRHLCFSKFTIRMHQA